ncbi:MAG TPA: type I-E CRISPR-associated protein Cas7/Cse4/CasC [Fimbriimonadaceae bacterium]|nr:type I-E CRISPR-associated protein Cas7/Cse4/CasC [Fimbriimonadaceae bacterium]
MLIEVHIIQNHAPSNLNRDDSGSPKSAVFGGYRRARISSQCLKRTYRTSKTFRQEVDKDLGMHSRSMPGEINERLRAYAAKLTGEDQEELKAKFEEWADKSQAKLAAILGKGGSSAGKVDDEDAEEASAGPETEEEDSGSDEESEASSGKKDKYQTAQSVFWREAELQALFEAYKKRIEWDNDIPDDMRNAFDDKGKPKIKDILKNLESIPEDKPVTKPMDAIRVAREKHPAKDGESDKAKKEREKKIKDGKSKADQDAAKALANLILERFDPKAILKEAGLRPEGIPVDMGLFGRMVASPLMHNVEASSQFAHAISTHEWQREFDMWTRVDDRRDKRLDFYKQAFGAEEKLESGTDGMGDQEFTSACYYSYFNVNFEALVDNLTGKALKHDLDDSDDREAAKKRASDAVAGLVKAAIFERPTGKFNSMATPSLPTLVLVEVRDSHVPVSYVNAFAKPVDPKNEETQNDQGQIQRVDLTQESAKRMIEEANRINKAFSRKATSFVFAGGNELDVSLEGGDTVVSVDDLVAGLRRALGCPQNANG